jgi:heme o synthase
MSLTNDNTGPTPDASAQRVTVRVTLFSDYLALTKPRVMLLVVFTAFVGLLVAPTQIHPMVGLAAIVCIAVGAGAAGALNMWYDAEIDATMTRTAARPIPRGRVSPRQALAFGLTTAAASVLALAFLTNLAAAALLALTIFFYIVVYTIWLKRSTPQSIVIGGAAGASPPLIAWIAATGQFGLEPFILFLIVFLWTPPHFWALSLNRVDDYRTAGIPTLPLVSGPDETIRQILVYTVLLAAASFLPWLLGFASSLYAAAAATTNAIFIALVLQLRSPRRSRLSTANRLFSFSICYIVILFAALLVEQVLTN